MASLAELKNEEREYREKMRTKNEVVGTPELLSAFQQFDADKSGTLEQSEFRHIMTAGGERPLSEMEFEDIMEAIDIDGDGSVDYAEFVAWIMGTATEGRTITDEDLRAVFLADAHASRVAKAAH